MIAAAEKLSHETSLADRFQRLRNEWKEQSQFLSNTTQMAMLRPYQQVIGMGPAVVPLILEELRREPDLWFWALEAITSEQPVSSEAVGHVESSATAWLEWGHRKGLIP